MAWICRYRRRDSTQPLVPGGKLTLVIVIIFGVAVVLLQIARELGVT